MIPPPLRDNYIRIRNSEEAIKCAIFSVAFEYKDENSYFFIKKALANE